MLKAFSDNQLKKGWISLDPITYPAPKVGDLLWSSSNKLTLKIHKRGESPP